MDDILNTYASSSEDNDHDDEAFVGPSRPPPTKAFIHQGETVTKHEIDDAEDVAGPSRPPTGDETRDAEITDDDVRIAWLRSLCEDPPQEVQEKDSLCSAPERYAARIELPPVATESANANASQEKVIEILLDARRRKVTPGDVIFASSAFTNPDFLQRCALDIGSPQMRGTDVRMPLISAKHALDSSDYYQALAAQQRKATEKHLAARNGISFTSAATQAPVEQHVLSSASTVDAGQKAAAAAAIAKARVEARIALQKAGKLH